MPTNILSLPPELHNEIGRLLSPQDAISLSQTCRDFHQGTFHHTNAYFWYSFVPKSFAAFENPKDVIKRSKGRKPSSRRKGMGNGTDYRDVLIKRRNGTSKPCYCQICLKDRSYKFWDGFKKHICPSCFYDVSIEHKTIKFFLPTFEMAGSKVRQQRRAKGKEYFWLADIKAALALSFPGKSLEDLLKDGALMGKLAMQYHQTKLPPMKKPLSDMRTTGLGSMIFERLEKQYQQEQEDPFALLSDFPGFSSLTSMESDWWNVDAELGHVPKAAEPVNQAFELESMQGQQQQMDPTGNILDEFDFDSFLTDWPDSSPWNINTPSAFQAPRAQLPPKRKFTAPFEHLFEPQVSKRKKANHFPQMPNLSEYSIFEAPRRQVERRPRNSNATTQHGRFPAPESAALQDYQRQLMLLEQQNKKRLLLARAEHDKQEAIKVEARLVGITMD